MASSAFRDPMSTKTAKNVSLLRGRPFKYTTAQAQKLIDKYFADCDKTKRPYTITGVAAALDTTRKSLCEWEREGHHLSNTIKRAKTRVEQRVEEMLLSSKTPAGAIFWLKNFGWTDKVDVGHSGNMTLEDLVAGSWGGTQARDLRAVDVEAKVVSE